MKVHGSNGCIGTWHGNSVSICKPGSSGVYSVYVPRYHAETMGYICHCEQLVYIMHAGAWVYDFSILPNCILVTKFVGKKIHIAIHFVVVFWLLWCTDRRVS